MSDAISGESGEPPKSRFPQISAYVAPLERDAFERYAGRLGISMSALLNLLVRRELRLHRLPDLRDEHLRPKAPQARKVIAHLDDSSLNESFAMHASRSGLVVAAAAAILIRVELVESWLEEAMLAL
jgi:hypothetical protein